MTAAGVAAWRTASGLDTGSTRVVGTNRPVNTAATDPLDQTAQNSPALRVCPTNPAHLAGASRIDSPVASCALHVSLDAGATWAETPVALPEGHVTGCFSPDLAFGADGTLYLVFTSFGPVEQTGVVPDAVWLATSRDGGRTMSAPARIAGPLAFQIRLEADPVRPGRLYLVSLAGSRASTWASPRTATPSSPRGPTTAVPPGGSRST